LAEIEELTALTVGVRADPDEYAEILIQSEAGWRAYRVTRRQLVRLATQCLKTNEVMRE